MQSRTGPAVKFPGWERTLLAVFAFHDDGMANLVFPSSLLTYQTNTPFLFPPPRPEVRQQSYDPAPASPEASFHWKQRLTRSAYPGVRNHVRKGDSIEWK